MKINIKPLSVNQGYQGRRFKTNAHKIWERSVLFLLPKTFIVPDYPLEIHLRFGFSSNSSDYDNAVKFFQDALSKKYGFNDKHIHRAVIEKTIVKPGSEFIEWDLKTLK